MNNSDAFIDKQTGRLVITNARLLPGSFKNFSGEAGPYNDKGKRNFCVVIPEELANILQNQEYPWNVRVLDPRKKNPESDEPVTHYIRVKVNYTEKGGPRIVRHIGKTSFECTEENVNELDRDYIENAVVEINPYSREGRDGVKRTTGYLYRLDVDIKKDYYDRMMADIPEKNMDGDPFNN